MAIRMAITNSIIHRQARASSEDDSSSSDDEASPGEEYGKSDRKDRLTVSLCCGGVRHVRCSSEKALLMSCQDKKTGGGYLKISILTSNSVTTCYNM